MPFQAREQCVTLGGDLVKVDELELWDALVAEDIDDSKVWIGGNKREWAWQDGKTARVKQLSLCDCR